MASCSPCGEQLASVCLLTAFYRLQTGAMRGIPCLPSSHGVAAVHRKNCEPASTQREHVNRARLVNAVIITQMV